jgi:nucleoside-diphosphate-sugar epimerase
MRVLVIGGTGFIGRYLIPDLLGRGATVAVLARGLSGNEPPPSVERITGDRKRLVDSAGAIRTFAPDVVVDCVLSSGT